MMPLDIEGHGGGGKGGGKPRVAQEAEDSLRSRALVRALIVLGEGEIAGIPAGRTLEQCVKLNGVPVQNADGSFNFSNVRLSLRTGTADQAHLPGFAAQEATTVKNAIVRQATPVDHVVTSADVDAVRVVVGVNQLTEQDTTNGDLNGASVSYRILVQEGAGPFVSRGDVTIVGKTLGGYQRAHRTDLPPGRPCTVRVERLSPDSDSAALQNDLFFAAAVNVTDAKLTFPHLACLGLEVPADEVQGRTPDVSVDLDWLVCWVPQNYDPVARTYAGIWNGTFKRAWTDNPAWCLYTLLRDELFGLGDRIAPEQIDKWAFYEIARYCDGLVDDGADGQEVRYRCNGPINTRESAQQWIATLCAAFRGAFAWTAGGFRPVADMPVDAVAVFTNANVVGGSFEYQGVPLSARASAAAVSIRDPSDRFRLKALAGWEEPDLIERFGWRQRDVSMPFETRLSGGVRAAKWVVDTDGRTGETVTFSAGGDAYPLTVFDPILISDRHRVNLRMGGRLVAVGANTLTLDAPVTFDPGVAYTLSTHNDTPELVEMPVAAGTSGSLSTVTLTGTVPAGVRAGHAWILTATTLSARRYRVLGVAENGATVQVVAIEEDPGKWARIEQGITLVQPPSFILPPGGALPAPGPIAIAEFARPRPGAAPEPWITVSWPSPDDQRIDRWRVEIRPPGNGWQLVGEIDQPTVDIALTAGLDGAYGIRVRALALTAGNESPWTTVEHIPTGLVIPLTTPTGVVVAPLINGFRVAADQHPAPNFRRLVAYVGASFSGTVLKGAGDPAGFDVLGLTGGTPVTVWVTADGWRQPESAPAGPFSVTPRRLQSSDFAADIISIGNLTQEARDLIGGDGAAVTAAAEAARDAAQAAQSAAEDAADEAETAALGSSTSAGAAAADRILAQAARIAAEAAQGAAGSSSSAAASHASAANASRILSQSDATAAQAARLAAEEARDDAGGFATTATGAAGTASSQASAAATQAGIATTKAGEAGASASAASTSATNAATSAGAAATSASTAQNAASTATTEAAKATQEAVVAASLGGGNLIRTPVFTAAGRGEWTAGTTVEVSGQAPYTHALRLTGISANGSADVRALGDPAGRVLRIRGRARTADGGRALLGQVRRYDAAGVERAFLSVTLLAAGQDWTDFDAELTVNAISNVAQWQFWLSWSGTGTIDNRILWLRVEDITQATAAATSATAAQVARTDAETAASSATTARNEAQAARDAASGSASAASTSASNAASSATAAGNSASAAQTAATTATTQAGQAASSATTATTQAGSATTQAGNAATSATAAQTARTAAESARDAASGSASAAATSASTASTQATAAGNSATAANAAKVSAESARDTASGSASAASSSASSASTSATNAGNSASAAASSALTAQTQAGIATTQAGVATTKAAEASDSAASASSASAVAASLGGGNLIRTPVFTAAGVGEWFGGSVIEVTGQAPYTHALRLTGIAYNGTERTPGDPAGLLLRIRGRARTADGERPLVFHVRRWDAAGAALTTQPLTVLAAGQDWADFDVTLAVDAIAGTAQWQIWLSSTSGTLVWDNRLLWLRVEDVTQATAAATSASAAQVARTDAETAASSATTARNEAQAARDVASGSASAASTSASNAGASATAANNSATAAQTARVAAESARDTASGSASAASTSASNAASSATSAGNSATASQIARTQAEAARNTAQGHASTAQGAASTATEQAALAAINATASARLGAGNLVRTNEFSDGVGEWSVIGVGPTLDTGTNVPAGRTGRNLNVLWTGINQRVACGPVVPGNLNGQTVRLSMWARTDFSGNASFRLQLRLTRPDSTVFQIWVQRAANQGWGEVTFEGVVAEDTASWQVSLVSDGGTFPALHLVFAPVITIISPLSAEASSTLAAKVTAAGAISAVDQRVSAASGGALATVEELTGAQTDLEGDARALRYLTVNANGNVATQLMGATDSGSLIKFSADRFVIENGASDVAPFEVSGGIVRIKNANIGTANIGTLNLANGASTTEKIAANAVTETTAVFVSGATINPTMISVAVDRSDGAPVVLLISCIIGEINNPSFTLELFRNGVLTRTYPVTAQNSAFAQTFYDGAAASGVVTYGLRPFTGGSISGTALTAIKAKR